MNHADLALRAGRSATGGLPRILGLDIAGEVAQPGAGRDGMEGGRPGRRRESRQVRHLLAVRARARRVLRATEAAGRRARRWPRAVLQGPRGQSAAHPRRAWASRRRRRFPWRAHRVALPRRAGAAAAVGGRPHPGGGQRGGELRSPDGQGHRRSRHRHGGERLEAREGQGAGRRRGDQLHHHAEVQPARQGAHRRPRRGRGVRLRRRARCGTRAARASSPAAGWSSRGRPSGSQIPFNLGGPPVPAADPDGQRSAQSPQLRRDDAHGALRRPARRGGRTFDLAEAAKAHEVMAGRDFFGKLVLRVP